MRQTEVEKLEIRLLGIISFDSEELRAKYKERIATAKETEKLQIIHSFNLGQDEESEQGFCPKGEQYYKETFNK